MNTSSTAPTPDDRTTGWRGSRAAWIEVAKHAFLDGGLEAVKIQPLAVRLNISRTSFYWFFKDRAALLDALVSDWDAKNTGAFVTACNAYADSVAEAVLNLIVVFNDDTLFEPQLDFAMRAWAHRSDDIAARVNAADAQRLQAIAAMFLRFGFPPDAADVRARNVYLTQIGYIAMQVRESRALRMSRVPRYVNVFCGQYPTDRDLARFHARLGYDPASPEPSQAMSNSSRHSRTDR